MSKSYIKSSGHYGGATDDCITTHGHTAKPYFGQDEALTASGHGAKEMTPEEAFFKWIIYGGVIDAQGMPVRFVRETGSGMEADRQKTTFNLAGWAASAKKFYTINKKTGEVKNYTIQAIQKTSNYFVAITSLAQLGFFRKNGKLQINSTPYAYYTYSPLPKVEPSEYAEGLTIDD